MFILKHCVLTKVKLKLLMAFCVTIRTWHKGLLLNNVIQQEEEKKEKKGGGGRSGKSGTGRISVENLGNVRATGLKRGGAISKKLNQQTLQCFQCFHSF